MKKTLFLLILVIFIITIGQNKAFASVKVIKKGNLLIGNATRFSNRTILNLFNHYWANKSKLRKQKAEKLYFWIVNADYNTITHPASCFANVMVAWFFKQNTKYIIKRKGNGFYYAIVDNYKVNLFTKKYSDAEKILTGKKYLGFYFSKILLKKGKTRMRSCNHPFLYTHKEMDILLMPMLIKANYY